MSEARSRVLLVEDDPAYMELLRQVLTGQFDIDEATTLAEALARLEAGPQVVVLDPGLPDARGVEAIRRVRAAAPGPAIIVLTGTDDEALALETIREGVQDYLVKALDPPQLIARSVRYALARKRRENELREAELVMERHVQARTSQLALAVSALQASEGRYRALVEISPDAIIMTDLEYRIVYCNQRGARLFGYERAESLVGANYLDLVAPEERDGTVETRAMLGLDVEAVSVERTFIRQDGSRFVAEINAGAVPDGDGQPEALIGIIRDISRRKQAQAERSRLESRLQQAEKLESLGVLAGGIAHDFNNLLQIVLGRANLLRRQPEGEAAARHAQEIERAAQRAAHLTQQMLAYAGKGRFVVRQLNLSVAVREMSHLLEAAAPAHVSLRYDLAPALPSVEADAEQMRQAVVNLVANAVDALEHSPGDVTIRTGVVDADGDYLAEAHGAQTLEPGFYSFLEVTDTGPGMDEATRARVFEPFFTTRFTGRGMGLPAVLGIARGHRGGLQVESSPGRGTAVRLLFPCAPMPAESPTEAKRPAARAPAGMILVVDDEEGVRGVAKMILEEVGYQVITASDGHAGVEVFRAHASEIALVLLDLTMPIMNGEEAFREIRRIQPDACVVIATGYDEQETSTRFAGRGLSGFIHKPYRLDELIEKVRDVLAGN